nr:hypothetical protein [uncultured Blautia sp.]
MNYLSKNCTDSHIALFFANAVHQIQGSGRQLFELAANDNFTRRIPVNHGEKHPCSADNRGMIFFSFSPAYGIIFLCKIKNLSGIGLLSVWTGQCHDSGGKECQRF